MVAIFDDMVKKGFMAAHAAHPSTNWKRDGAPPKKY
jgi:hypothetical protein